MEFVKLIVRTLLLPPGGLLLLLVLALWLWQRRPRLARALVGVVTLALWLGSLPVAVTALEQTLMQPRVLDPARAASAQAIVITAGGLRPFATEYGGVTLGRLTLERVRYGAALARRHDLPLLVTGGGGRSGRTEGDLMQAALEQEYKLPVRWVENRSRNTRENAAESARLLRPTAPDGVRRIALVAHGFDIRRAQAEFEAVGFEVLPAPTQVAELRVSSVADLLPSVAALERCHFLAYEALALIARRLGID